MRSLHEEMFHEAKEYFINGNYNLAEPLLQQILLQNSRNPEIYQMLATIAYDKGQFSKAIKTFKKALEVDPAYTDASVGLSIILNDLGKYDDAKKVFLDAQEILDKKSAAGDPSVDEKFASKHEELGDLYFQYNRYTEALEQFYKALKLTTRRADLVMRIADTFMKLDQADKAIKELKNLILEYPQLINPRLKLGIIFYNMNHLAEATEQWENVLLRDSQNPEALRYLRMAQAAGITQMEL